MSDSHWIVRAEQTLTLTFEVAADDASDRDALVAGYLSLRRTSENTGVGDLIGAFFGYGTPTSVTIIKTEPGPWRITPAEEKTAADTEMPPARPGGEAGRAGGA